MIDSSTSHEPTLEPANWNAAYREFLINFATPRVSDRSTAEDLVQETFLSAWRGRESFRGDCSERTWLTGVLRNKIIDLYRHNSRRPLLLESDIESSSNNDDDGKTSWLANRTDERDHNDPSMAADRAEILSLVDQAVDHLPETMGRAFRMRELEGCSTEEITEQLHISKNNLWVLIHRAKAMIQIELGPTWSARAAVPQAA